jgi:hypothetical protein
MIAVYSVSLFQRSSFCIFHLNIDFQKSHCNAVFVDSVKKNVSFFIKKTFNVVKKLV